MKKITVMLVDDHTVVREGLRALLQPETDIEVIAEAENGRQAVIAARKHLPDVVIMDIAMPLLNGMEATRQIRKSAPNTKVLVLSSYEDEECTRQLMLAGAAGFLLKQAAAGDLSKAIRELRRGNSFFSPAIARHLRDRERALADGEEFGRQRGGLTAREAEVLQLVAEGYSNRQAAVQLGISIKTIEKHRQQVMNKLNIHETAGLTRYALSRGLVEGIPVQSFAGAAA